jgi:hypothetical protein
MRNKIEPHIEQMPEFKLMVEIIKTAVEEGDIKFLKGDRFKWICNIIGASPEVILSNILKYKDK